MHSAAKLSQYIGQSADYRAGELTIAVVIHDAKSAYGKIRCRIEPLAGSGSQWVELDSLKNLQSARI